MQGILGVFIPNKHYKVCTKSTLSTLHYKVLHGKMLTRFNYALFFGLFVYFRHSLDSLGWPGNQYHYQHQYLHQADIKVDLPAS